MWAAGIMLYEMLTGKHPFYTADENQGEYVERIKALKYCDLISLPR